MSKEIEKMTAIYEKHKNTMYAVALKILKNPQDAEDAVHNTIPPIMRNLDAIKDVDSKDCIYYVTMAVKHMSFNMIRDRHIQTVSLSDIEYEFASDENIAESVIIDESCKIIYQNIKSMPAEYRDVLILHLYYELSTSQISDFLNRKHGTVKSQLETQADNISSESEEKHDLTSLDEKVYAMLGTNQNKHKTAAVWSFRKISALAATFVLVISLSITAVFVLNKEPEHIAQDVFYSITISYENEQYGYFSNRLVIDKYGLNNISDLKQNPDLFTGILTETDIIQTDSVIDKDSIIGAKIYPYSDEVIILQGDGQFYYFEKIVTD